MKNQKYAGVAEGSLAYTLSQPSVAGNLVTDNLEIWTTAQKNKKTVGRGSSNKQEAYGIKKLRELILELAVRGKLIPQDARDEPASVLLEKIAEEREALAKKGIIKKKKPFPMIENDEKPINLPKGWAWARIDEVGHNWGQKKPDSDFTYIDVSAIDSATGTIKTPNTLTASDAPSRARKLVKSGTVIYSTIRPYLQNICIIDHEFSPEPIVSTAFAILHPFQNMPGNYFTTYFRSPIFIRYVESVQTGIAYPAINDKQFFGGVIPIPPLTEQHRIVAKVDELMALCDQLEQQQAGHQATHLTLVETLLNGLIESAKTGANDQQNTADIFNQLIAQHFDTLFTTEQSIDQLKQTILQLAVMGKLVPQDHNDEPASVLLEKIAEEKTRLIEAGKIKKQKALPEVGENEKPFELPGGWEYSRLGTFTIVGTGSTPARGSTEYYSPAEISWVTSGETSNDFIAETKEKISPLAVKETNVTVYPVGSLIVAMYGQGKTRGQVSELLIEAGTNQACAAIQLIDKEEHHRKYIKLFFKKAYEELRSHAAGGAQPNLNLGKVSQTVIPIPPLAEQYRIVSIVNELLTLCDSLKANLNQAQTTQTHLADAIVEQAVA